MRLSQSGLESDFQSTTHWVHILKLHHWGRVQSVENNVSFPSTSNDRDRREMFSYPSSSSLKGESLSFVSSKPSEQSVVMLHFTNLVYFPGLPSNTSVWIQFESDVKAAKVKVFAWVSEYGNITFSVRDRLFTQCVFSLTCPCTDHCGD